MGEMAEYELGMLREDDIEDRIDELRRLLGESETQRKAAIAKLRTCRMRRRKLEAFLREALPRFYSWHYQGGYYYCEECEESGGYQHDRDSVVHKADCFVGRGEKLLEGADAEEVI